LECWHGDWGLRQPAPIILLDFNKKKKVGEEEVWGGGGRERIEEVEFTDNKKKKTKYN
jgi:hypothetical protein